MILSEPITEYMRRLAERYDEPVLVSMEERAAANGFPIVGRLCGVLIELMASAIGAKRVFEMGSGFGYSAYWFARAVGPSGRVYLTDGDPANAEMARDYLGRAGLWDRVDFEVADALTAFARVGGDDFDIVYCDVDKEGYPDCWRAARDRIRVGGLWICDNSLWYGRVTDDDKDDQTKAIDEHNRLVSSDPDYVSSIVPIRDGVMVALRTR